MICKRILLVVGIIIPLSVLAQTKEECIADKMEGVADDCAAAARRFCERYVDDIKIYSAGYQEWKACRLPLEGTFDERGRNK